MRRISISIAASLALCLAAAAAQAGSDALRPGEYITQGGGGTLTISTSEGRTTFSIELLSPMGTCSLAGEIRNLRARLEVEGEDKACIVRFLPKADVIEVSSDSVDCHRYFCGARVGFEDEYHRPVDRVIFEMRSIERKEGSDTASFSYPVIKTAPSEALRVALKQEIDTFLAGDDGHAATPEEAADDFLAEARRGREVSPEAAGIPWSLGRSAEIAYQDAKVVSLRLFEGAYTGGAHGGSSVRYMSFDPATGRRLGLADLIKPGGEARLLELGERELRKLREIPPEESLEEAGFTFKGGKFALGRQMAVLAEGLAIYYNLYEIAPYVAGPTEILIPRSKLAPIAKPGGPFN